ncbi:hypothetical protein [Spirillospora sp. CA-128828]|uniref:hypothetical protein n=1 Tax=Spirillospora sp. CA-128828 TaxID=3240033 RepID=UPI003D916461
MDCFGEVEVVFGVGEPSTGKCGDVGQVEAVAFGGAVAVVHLGYDRRALLRERLDAQCAQIPGLGIAVGPEPGGGALSKAQFAEGVIVLVRGIEEVGEHRALGFKLRWAEFAHTVGLGVSADLDVLHGDVAEAQVAAVFVAFHWAPSGGRFLVERSSGAWH